jgi:hypothetical protein
LLVIKDGMPWKAAFGVVCVFVAVRFGVELQRVFELVVVFHLRCLSPAHVMRQSKATLVPVKLRA